MKRKRAKRILMVFSLIILVALIFTGCGKDFNVISKWDAKEISLYSDDSCVVELSVKITDGKVNYNSKKEVELESEKTQIIKIKDFPVNKYFGDHAEFSEVIIEKTKKFDRQTTILIVIISVFGVCSGIIYPIVFFISTKARERIVDEDSQSDYYYY